MAVFRVASFSNNNFQTTIYLPSFIKLSRHKLNKQLANIYLYSVKSWKELEAEAAIQIATYLRTTDIKQTSNVR